MRIHRRPQGMRGFNMHDNYSVVTQVREELRYFADAVQAKLTIIKKMTGQLRAPYKPKPNDACEESSEQQFRLI